MNDSEYIIYVIANMLNYSLVYSSDSINKIFIVYKSIAFILSHDSIACIKLNANGMVEHDVMSTTIPLIDISREILLKVLCDFGETEYEMDEKHSLRYVINSNGGSKLNYITLPIYRSDTINDPVGM